MHRFSIHNCLIYILQIMISSQLFEQKNTSKYRAKVDFFRIYDTNKHEWTYYYSHEKQSELREFLNTISKTITAELAAAIGYMAYRIYEFYYYAPNIKVRKQGDKITIYYDAIRK